MIGRLRGEVIERAAGMVVIDVHGVGYVVSVSASAHLPVGTNVDLHVYTHVREDALQLFGFGTALEREVFNHLITVPNVGPVKAMAILATPAEEIVRTVAQRNAAKLAKLPGVGKKTAERLLVDLAEKFDGLLPSVGGVEGAAQAPVLDALATTANSDVVSALVNLGFKPSVAEEAAKLAVSRRGADVDLSVLVKEALASLRS
ncbi:MAG: Holliday junction branch migration protein RuvA [Deltaproteobacteria bacterium]|nr:Holliday junction branch migration protein RuvA [Deltaproteobacteria bacterium]